MIIVKLQGGLGNQLFQYAFGHALAKASGKQVRYDATDYGRAGRLSRRCRLANEYLRCVLRGRDWGAHRTQLRLLDLEYFAPDLPEADERQIALSRGEPSHPSVFREQDFSPGEIVRARDGYYDGTWSLEYIRSIADRLPALLPVKAKADLIAPVAGSVCVHVRRGDFTTPEGIRKHGPCQPEYFQAAACEISRRATGPLRFFVFSDDISWCQANLRLPAPTSFVENLARKSSALSLDIMRQCEHFILSNSTFSLWAAFLGRKPSSQIITPHPWFDRDSSWTSGLCGDIRLDKVSGKACPASAEGLDICGPTMSKAVPGFGAGYMQR